ncbi:fumarylacetoacetate hydrolase family protein [Dehalococcoidia bacterium]|nr:fumarylacetoacetate hydrolase family protein [Dehalococcoidia bacterium]
MKIGFYNDFIPCLITPDGVVDISDIVANINEGEPQLLIERLISSFDSLRPSLEAAQSNAQATPLDQVQLRAPLPRPGKVLCGNTNYKEYVPIEPPRPLRTFFKSPDAIIGPGDTISLPKFRPTIFNHEAELAIVIGKQAKNLQENQALSHVFGYTTGVDVSARAPEEGEAGLPGGYGKSFDTFLPIGPAITTADEISNPNNLQVRYWVNGELRQDYNTDDMEHSVAYTIAALSHVMTLQPGDLILAGTNHSHLGPLQDGDFAEIEIESIGRNGNHVQDDLKRSWDPHDLRQPEVLVARREAQKTQPNTGTWPFQKFGGES